jgi:hypothetical protein
MKNDKYKEEKRREIEEQVQKAIAEIRAEDELDEIWKELGLEEEDLRVLKSVNLSVR